MGKKYESNFLKQVIFRVDFTRGIDQSKKLAESFYNRDIADFFPNKEEIKGVIVEASFVNEPESQKVVQSQRDVTTFKFSDNDKKKILTLEQLSLILSINNSYQDSDELKKIIRQVIGQLKSTYGRIIAKRIGLRYINIIDPSGESTFDWDTYISDNLISMLNFVPDKSEMIRAMSLIELNKENCRIKFQFGMFNSEYPNPIARKEFVLDYDCYTTEEIELNDVEDTAGKFHEEIKKLFEDSIKQGLRDKMGEIKDA